MGHRANYAIRQDGEVDLFYSTWGALTVPRDVFWGPEYAEAFIRRNRKVADDEWLDDVFGEGGVALDCDSREMVMFGGEQLGYAPFRDVFLGLINGLWQRWDWSVRWAQWGIPDLVGQMGGNPQSVTSGPMPSMVPRPEQVGAGFRERGRVKALVTVIGADGPRDFVADHAAGDLVAMGPTMLTVLGELPTLQEARHHWEPPSFVDDPGCSMASAFSSCLCVDRRRRHVEYTGYLRFGELLFNDIRWEDSGWTIAYRGDELDDVRRHYEATGRPVPDAFADCHGLARRSEDDCLAVVAGELFGGGCEDPSQPVREMVASQVAECGEPDVDASLLECPPDGRPDPETCRKRFGWALAAWVR